MTCIASALSMANAEMITPDMLRELKGYEADVCQDVSPEILEEYLYNGKCPIVRVRMNGIGNFQCHCPVIGTGEIHVDYPFVSQMEKYSLSLIASLDSPKEYDLRLCDGSGAVDL